MWSATYDAFGKATVDSASTVTNNLRFPGQIFDPETGLHYNWQRYYDPKTGRYPTSDPIGLKGGVNFYTYTMNDPVNFIDPNGTILVPIVTGGIGAITSGFGYAAGRWARGCGIDYGDLAAAVGIGAIQGALVPFVGLLGNAAIGGVGNVAQDAISSGGSLSGSNIAQSFAIGAFGSAIGGSYSRSARYGYSATAASREMVNNSNAFRDLRRNTGVINFGRGFAGSTFSTIAGTEGCGCK